MVTQYSPFGTPTDFPITRSDFGIHSPRLQELIRREVSGQVQYLPFRLQLSYGDNEITGYAIANLLRRIDCLDRQRSEVAGNDFRPYEPLGDFPVQKAVLSRSLIGDHRLFRVLGDCLRTIVRQDLAQAIESLGLTGCVFKEIPVSE